MLLPRHALRYGAYGLGVALLQHPSPAARAVLLLLAGLYLGRSLRRMPAMLQQTANANPLAAGALTPVLRVVGDLAKMCGLVAGLSRRLRP